MESVHLLSLIQWLERFPQGSVRDLDELKDAIGREISLIDQKLQDLVRRVLHHPRFQRIESSFRSISSLFHSTKLPDFANLGLDEELPPKRDINLFVLDVSAEELVADLSVSSHGRTELFRKLFQQRFDMPIGEQNINIDAPTYPFNLILANFEFCFPGVDVHRNQIDLNTLRQMAKIGERCFCMFLLGLAPEFFDPSFEDFGQLNEVIDIERIVQSDRYRPWQEFRRQDEARMIGLALPRMIVREPYSNFRFSNGIAFDESSGRPSSKEHLWGNAIFAVVQPIMRSFLYYDWFSDVCGIDRDFTRIYSSDEIADEKYEPGYDGGFIEAAPLFGFDTDLQLIGRYPPVDFIVSEPDESVFSKLGFISLFSVNNSPFLATLTSQTAQMAVEMTTSSATNNVRLSTLFNHMLNACRKAHRVMRECRKQIGGSTSAKDFEYKIHAWLMEKTSNRSAQLIRRQKEPFDSEQTGFVAVEDVTDPGKFDCQIRLCPHHKFDNGKTRIIFEPISLELQLNSKDE